MSGKQYQQLGKTQLTRVPETTVVWVKKLVREIDKKEEPEKTMELLLHIAQQVL